VQCDVPRRQEPTPGSVQQSAPPGATHLCMQHVPLSLAGVARLYGNHLQDCLARAADDGENGSRTYRQTICQLPCTAAATPTGAVRCLIPQQDAADDNRKISPCL
jgi:hypothetical protein